MRELEVSNDYKNIILNNVHLIDVMAPIEYEKGSFRNAVNMPILNNEERHIIGICYKENGNEEATKLGYQIVSGKVRDERINNWSNYINEHQDAMIYCFRGGSRSTIAQKWIFETTGKNIVKLEGGYKAFRNYLITSLEPENITAKPLIITGYTGSGKTILLNKVKNSIDLEGVANHRGSTFGHHITPQPSQINFENNLAYDIVKHNNRGYKYIVVEDEGKNIGKSFIPQKLYSYFRNGDLVLLEATIEERVDNILLDYVINSQAQFIKVNKEYEIGIRAWYDDMINSMLRVKSKLGGDRFKSVIDEFNNAYINQKSNNTYEAHRNWIEMFLRDYYDPMYKYSINMENRKIVFKGNKDEVLKYLIEIEK